MDRNFVLFSNENDYLSNTNEVSTTDPQGMERWRRVVHDTCGRNVEIDIRCNTLIDTKGKKHKFNCVHKTSVYGYGRYMFTNVAIFPNQTYDPNMYLMTLHEEPMLPDCFYYFIGRCDGSSTCFCCVTHEDDLHFLTRKFFDVYAVIDMKGEGYIQRAHCTTGKIEIDWKNQVHIFNLLCHLLDC